MKLHRTRPRRRSGFTLVELLVVIGIIALLVSLLAGAAIFAFNKVDQVKTQREIGGLGSALTQFEADFNIRVPPPSRLWLDNSSTPYSVPPAGYTPAQVQQLGIDSQTYLRQVWPRVAFAGADWTSSGTTPAAPFNGILEGEEVLVLFLGGARSGGAFVGFATADPTKPMDTTSPGVLNKRKGPYYQFDMSRVATGPSGSFGVYIDPYGSGKTGTPYAYFSSINGANHYDAYAAAMPAGKQHDCFSLNATLMPYSAGARYYNADTFQIISAGKNQQFGPGGPWTPLSGPGGTGLGADDMSNFYDSRLGVVP